MTAAHNPDSASSSLLEIRNLSVAFETARGLFKAVDGIDLSVRSGEVLAIVGESGSGKSVAMLAVMGLLPESAHISADILRFNGRDMLAMKAREKRAFIGRDISMIFQEPITSLNPCFTVGYQVGEVLGAHLGLRGKARQRRVIELLEAVGISNPEARLFSYPHQMSGGQCQRIMIAQAIACSPKLLIADEPTTALDVTIQKQILDLLKDLQRRSDMGLIMITHDMGVVAETADRVIVQYNGKKMEEADILPLFENPQNDYTKALLSALPENAKAKRLPTIKDYFAENSAAAEPAANTAEPAGQSDE